MGVWRDGWYCVDGEPTEEDVKAVMELEEPVQASLPLTYDGIYNNVVNTSNDNIGVGDLVNQVKVASVDGPRVRYFTTGANRSLDMDKPDYEGFISPLVTARFGEYMHKHRSLPDGCKRDSDNWQKGIPKDAYIKSGTRHHHDWLMVHRGYESVEPLEEALCALIFNASGYLYEVLKERNYRGSGLDKSLQTPR